MAQAHGLGRGFDPCAIQSHMPGADQGHGIRAGANHPRVPDPAVKPLPISGLLHRSVPLLLRIHARLEGGQSGEGAIRVRRLVTATVLRCGLLV